MCSYQLSLYTKAINAGNRLPGFIYLLKINLIVLFWHSTWTERLQKKKNTVISNSMCNWFKAVLTIAFNQFVLIKESVYTWTEFKIKKC